MCINEKMVFFMKKFLIKAGWFLLGFTIFLVVEGVFYHAPKAAGASNTAGIALIGAIFFIVWAVVLGFFSARKNYFNWPFITGANIGYILASMSIKPVLICTVVFSVWKYAYKQKHITNAL